MQHQLDVSDLGKPELALLIDGKAGLRIRQRVIAQPGFKARVARLLSCFDTAEEGLKGFVHPMQDILQDLRIDRFVFGTNRFDVRQLRTLLGEADALATQLVGISALLQGRIVEVCT